MFELAQLLHFSHPDFILGIIIPFAIMAISYLLNFHSSNRYCDKSLLPWVLVENKTSIADKLLLNKIIPILAWILFCTALSGPRINIDERSLEPNQKYNNATVFVLDISKSMLAEDVYPNRITKAKLAIESIISNTNRYLFGLVVFANNAHIVIPLTYDSNVIRDVLTSIQPNMLPIEGSNFNSGLNKAAEQLKLSDASNKSIILFSDGDFGENTKNPLSAEIKDIPVNVFGVGTQEGQPIPDKDGGWLTIDNKSVISSLNVTSLKKIARRHNGSYKTITSDIKQEEFNLKKYSGHTTSSATSNKTIVIWKQVYQWFLIPAIILFFLSTLRYKAKGLKSQSHLSVMVLFGLSFLMFTPSSSQATENIKKSADIAYHNKNFIKSESLYKKLNDFEALMGQGNSVYRQKNYSKAINLYTRAILNANKDDMRATALFNLANTYYIIGDYPQSIRLYADTLKYNSTLKQARINLEYAITINEKVKREIALRNGNKRTLSAGTRLGNGPRSEKIEQGVDVGNSKVTLSDDDSNTSPLYELPLNSNILNKLIERGIKYSNISSTTVATPESNSQWNFEYTTLDMVELLVKQEKIDSHNLWKRLFEIEEGFPAPVETPHVKPGVQPW